MAKHKAKKEENLARLPVVVPAPARKSQPIPHPHRSLDRAARATLARATGGVSPFSILEAWTDWALHLSRSPGRQMELAERAQVNFTKLMAYAMSGVLDEIQEEPFESRTHDHRFDHASWNKPPYNLWKQGFLATQDWWDAAAEDMPGLKKQDADRIRFHVRQALDLVSPSNFPWSNPEIAEKTLESRGKNLMEGAKHFSEDLSQTLLQTRRPVPKNYQIGKHLACSPGKVVFRNELFELIQYEPQADKVQAEPVLFIPAWIMKYYILDLSPQNSMVNHLVRQGFTVFMISWCNPTADQAHLTLDDYRKLGVMAAIDAIGAL